MMTSARPSTYNMLVLLLFVAGAWHALSLDDRNDNADDNDENNNDTHHTHADGLKAFLVDTDCGTEITLNATHLETTIEANSTGRTDMNCSWIVKGSSEKGTLVLNFEEFDVKTKGNDGKTCMDTVEVRHATIGALGLTYCGTKVGHSIRTITNKALIRFSTYGASKSSFKLRVKWIPDTAMCYDVKDRGAGYTGTVNYTRTFTPCLPWAQVTKCHHHPFQHGDEMANLDGNFCRNPDDSFRPWCYTDTDGCKRNYCDVCKLETPFDRAEGCQELRTMGFCTRNATDAVRSCAATCYDLLPSTGPVEIYSQIECDPPTLPSDLEMVGTLKSKYLLGEKVEFGCMLDRSSTITSTCLTDGNWTAVDYTCRECPLGEAMYKNFCYGLVENGRLFKYADAKKTCKNLGGSIAMPRSSQNSKVIDSVRQMNEIWISATDIAKEGTFVDEDGQRLAWTNWNYGEPNNWDGKEDCVTMLVDSTWNDVFCWTSLSLVCATPKLYPKKCHDILGEFCSRLTKTRPSMCTDFPDYAKKYCPNTCGICGGTNVTCSVQPPNPDVSVSTTDATIAVGSFVTYHCDRYAYPLEGDRVQVCRADGQLDGTPLVCGDCPLGFVHVKGSCHGLLQGRQLTFSQATDECRKLGGFVAYPRNEAENNFIHYIAAPARLWLGITAVGDTSNKFVLENGLPMSWSNWATSGESRRSGEGCVGMAVDKKWHTTTCDDILHQVVCTVPRSGRDVCYDEESLGQDYNGKVNHTIDFVPCIPWVDAANVCPHHPFKAGDERDDLESNYCRNPDASARPWCYTSTAGCERKYCDVCGLDRDGNCKQMKEEGLCLKDVTWATLLCASTCHDLLPNSGPTENYLKIECDTPIPPSDGDIVGATESKYRLGERVGFKCKRNQNVIYTTCLTSSEWSPVGLACQDCPFGYVEFNNICYGFVDKKLYYHEAQEECRQYGGYLPRPVSRDENTFISTLLNKHYNIWLGGKRIGGSFFWNDGTKVDETHWTKGGPTNRGNCMYTDSSGEWDDTDCDSYWPALRLVCAVPKLDNVLCRDFLGLDYCQELLVGRSGMCGDYPDFATRFCAQTCGICRSDSNTITCPVPAIVDPSSSNRTTVSITSTNAATIPMGSVVEYTCVKHKYQTGGDAVRHCLANGELTGAPMECHRDCPLGYDAMFNGKCYCFIDESLPFNDAEAECKKRGGMLAAPKSPAENDFLVSLSEGEAIWIGLTDRIKWLDGTAVGWTNWDAGQPDNCTLLYPDKKWNNVPCSIRFSTVCAIER